MDSVSPLSTFGKPTGEFIDDDNLTIADHILAIQMVVAKNTDSPLDVFVKIHKGHGAYLVGSGKGSDVLSAFGGQLDFAAVFLKGVVFLIDKMPIRARRPIGTRQ